MSSFFCKGYLKYVYFSADSYYYFCNYLFWSIFAKTLSFYFFLLHYSSVDHIFMYFSQVSNALRRPLLYLLLNILFLLII